MATYGEFIDAVNATQITEAKLFMEEWMAMATEEKLAEFRPMELTRELVLLLAEDMATFFRERIMGICTEALYNRMVKSGHTFLREIHAAAVALGIDVDEKEVDMPLTMTEVLVASGAARVVACAE